MLRMDAPLLAAIDAYAEANGLTRPEAIRVLAKKGLEEWRTSSDED